MEQTREKIPFYLYQPEQNVRYTCEAELRIRSLRLANGCGLARTPAWGLSLGVIGIRREAWFRTNRDAGCPGRYHKCALQIS